MPLRLRSFVARSCTAGLALSLLGACTSADRGAPAVSGEGGERLHVVVSFYPLGYVTQRVGGARVEVDNLTPPGAEPHDIELSTADAASLQDADLVVYLSGFSAAVDEAIDDVAGGHSLDVAVSARLDLTYTPIEEGRRQDAGTDPHFWLDPLRLADVADAVAARLAQLDPASAGVFRDNARGLRADLGELDAEYRTGLANCASTVIVTSHNAFGYLAQRYGMQQVGITGLTPEDEPTPKDLAAVADYVTGHDVRTIYYETLVSPAIAETIAAETGADTEVLDPIEGLAGDSGGNDYLSVMRANLANLRRGQGCT